MLVPQYRDLGMYCRMSRLIRLHRSDIELEIWLNPEHIMIVERPDNHRTLVRLSIGDDIGVREHPDEIKKLMQSE